MKDFNLFVKTMLSYCLKCRKNTEGKSQKLKRQKKERAKFSSKCVFVLDSKKLIFIKEQEARELITNLLGIELPFEGVDILDSII